MLSQPSFALRLAERDEQNIGICLTDASDEGRGFGFRKFSEWRRLSSNNL